MHITIFANGELPDTDIVLEPKTIIIAVDGGLHHCSALDLNPDILIGDFDSISEDDVAKYKGEGVKLIKFPSLKDETDLELALIHAVELGAQEITLYGLLGGRWDMNFSNIMLLSSPRFDQVRFYIESGETSIRILRGGMKLNINKRTDDRLSIIPLCPQANGITLKGLEWILDNASLDFGSQRGLSNRILNEEAIIQLRSGKLLVIIEKIYPSSASKGEIVYSTLNGSDK
jgi:thiamine pyrophosphokinase